MGTKINSNYEDLLTFTRASKGHALRPVSYGTELVTNGTFDSDASGWSGSNATVSSVNSQLVVTNSSTAFGRAYQGVTTEVGKLYQFSCDVNYTGDGGRIRLGTTSAGSEIYEQQSITEDKTVVVNFVATTTTTYIRLGLQANTSGNSIQFDNASLKEVTFDQTDGTLTLFEHPNNVPRVEWDADRNRLGLLVEESRTNLITYSEDFSNSYWSTASITPSPNGPVSPDRSNSSVNLSATGNNGAYIARSNLGSSGGSYTVSVFAKAGTHDIIRITNQSSGNTGGWFDLTNGTTLTENGANNVSSIQYVGNGWYRCIRYFDSWINTNNSVLIGVSSTDGSTGSVVGHTVSLWGAQVEAGSFPTSYIKTTGSTATRSADVASIPVADFGYNVKAGALVVDFNTPNALNDDRIAVISTGSSYRVIDIAKAGSDLVNYSDASGADIIGSFVAEAKAAVSFKSAKEFASVQNGGEVQIDTTGNEVTKPTTLFIGSWATLNDRFPNGHIKSIQYYPRRLTNAQIEALTEPRSTPTLSLTFDGLESSYTENYIHG